MGSCSAAAAMATVSAWSVLAVVTSAARDASPGPGPAGAWDAGAWELVLLTDAAAAGGVCLDGTPGGYYVRRGAPGNKRWVLFFEGGGWCTDDVSCAARAHTRLGSSANYSAAVPMPDWYEGSQLYATPPFDTATLVHAMYCDGGSWAGQASAGESPALPSLDPPPGAPSHLANLHAPTEILLRAGLCMQLLPIEKRGGSPLPRRARAPGGGTHT